MMIDKKTAFNALKQGGMAAAGLTSFGVMGNILIKGSETLINKAQELKENGTIDQLSE